MLLYDERNPMFLGEGGCYSTFQDAVPKRVRSKCHALTVQQAMQALAEYHDADLLQGSRNKYL